MDAFQKATKFHCPKPDDDASLARKMGIDPEVALEGTNVKFEERFASMEQELRERGSSLEEASLEEMEEGWVHSKRLGASA